MFAVLEPLLRSGVFKSGPDKLTCAVGGRVYSAALGVNGEIICNCGCLETYRSPSAFSVHIKRKVNPARKADDGWTSTKYMGVALAQYRGALEQLASNENANNSSGAGPAQALLSLRKQKRKKHHLPSSQGADEELQEDENKIAAALAADKCKRSAASQTDKQQARAKLQQHHCQSTAPGGGKGCITTSVPDAFLQSPPPPRAPDEGDQDNNDAGAAAQCTGRQHAAGSTRPPLHACSEAAFEADVIAFLVARGDEHLAAAIRDKRITCNHTPLDLLGLYRAVVARGGLADNEHYDDRGRWNGGINFAGEVFPKLKNFTANNRATSVGNQLLNNYKKFLLAYEKAYRSRDITAAAAAPLAAHSSGVSADGTSSTQPAPHDGRCTDDVLHPHGPLAVLAEAAGAKSSSPQQQLQQQLQQQQQQQEIVAGCPDTWQQQMGSHLPAAVEAGAAAYPPPARFANAEHAQPHKRRRLDSGTATSSSYVSGLDVDRGGAPAAADADKHPNWHTDQPKLQQQCHVVLQQQGPSHKHQLAVLSSHSCGSQAAVQSSVQHVLQLLHAGAAASAAAEQNLGTWCMPGSLVLAQLTYVKQQQGAAELQQQGSTEVQQQQLQQQVWAAVVADVSQLPVTVAEAGLDVHLPAQQQEHGNALVPVLLLGSQHLVWASPSKCQPFTLPAAHAALSAAWPHIDCAGQSCHQAACQGPNQAEGEAVAHCHISRVTVGQPEHDTVKQQLLCCLRGLKQAAQWMLSCSDHARSEAAGMHPQLQQQPRAWVTTAGLKCVAQKLLLLEGQLPLEGLANRSSWFWEGWRAAVAVASTPEQLSHQVLMLAYQADAALKEGVADSMWAELQPLLGMQTQLAAAQAEARFKQASNYEPLSSATSSELPSALPLQQQLLQLHHEEAGTVLSAPSVLTLDQAVHVLATAMDWPRLQYMWHHGLIREAACSAALPCARQNNSAAACKQQRQHELQQPPMIPNISPEQQQQQQMQLQLQQTDNATTRQTCRPLLPMLTYSAQAAVSPPQGLQLPPPLPLDLGSAAQPEALDGHLLALQGAQLLLAKLLSSTTVTGSLSSMQLATQHSSSSVETPVRMISSAALATAATDFASDDGDSVTIPCL